jgi:hypothetical protein
MSFVASQGVYLKMVRSANDLFLAWKSPRGLDIKTCHLAPPLGLLLGRIAQFT